MIFIKKLFTLSLLLLIFFSSSNIAWSKSVEKQAVLAVLTFNIARFSTWPEHAFKQDQSFFNLCVYGDNVVQHSFQNINNKMVNKKTIQVINVSRLRGLNQCQLLYISGLEQNKLIPLLEDLKGNPILTIGENMEILQAGGIVGLEKVNGKIQFTINLAIVKQSGLIISSRLLNLAKIINYPSPTHKD